MSVWIAGRVSTDAEEPLAHDRGLLLGDGLFETVLVERGVARFAELHLARMRGSAAALGIAWPRGLARTVGSALPRLAEIEGRPARGVLRITLTRGTGRGLGVPVGPPRVVLAFGALPPRRRGTCAPPARAVLLAAPRIDPADPLAGHKTLSSMARVEARRRAVARGADVALVATIDGDVAEADSANLFLVIDGRVVTPALSCGALPGITRARCLEALAAVGRPAIERAVPRCDVVAAEEAFVTSSLDGVRPLCAIGDRRLVAPGPVARRLVRLIGR